MSKQTKEEAHIEKAFNKALEEGTMTDILGDPVTREDFREVNDKQLRAYVELHSLLIEDVANLKGHILTIIDATYDDKERAKYVKDVIKRELLLFVNHYIDMAQIGLTEKSK